MPEQYTEGFLAALDGRCRVTRELRARLDAVYSDLGGESAMSYQQRSLAKRAIHLEAHIERVEAKLAQGKDVDINKLTQSTNTLIGLWRALGLERKARDVTPNPLDYARQKAREAAS